MDKPVTSWRRGPSGLVASPPLTSTSPAFPSSLSPPVMGTRRDGSRRRRRTYDGATKPPWTILAANDLACLVFRGHKSRGQKDVDLREVVQEERRAWLEKKLKKAAWRTWVTVRERDHDSSADQGQQATSLLGARASAITAKLLQQAQLQIAPRGWQRLDARRRSTAASASRRSPATRIMPAASQRVASVPGDVVPIQKRNGATGSARLWVKEKRVKD